MSDFTDWTQDELAVRPSTAAIEATGSFLVKADNAFSKDYDALAQGTVNQVLLSQGASANPAWADDAPFSIDKLDVDIIADADTLAFYDNDGTHNNKITFVNFESTLEHDKLTSGTIVDHDTSATGAQLDTLTDDSVANTLHRHSELVASDGDPDPALSVDADGKITVAYSLIVTHDGNDTAPLGGELVSNGTFASDLSSWTAGANWAWEATGVAEHTAGSVETLLQGISVTNGETYHIEFTTSNRTAGSIVLTFGAMVGSVYSSGNNTYYWSFKAVSTGSVNLTFTPATNWDGRLDDVTVKQITGVSDPIVLLKDSGATDVIEVRAAESNIFIGVNTGGYNTSGYRNVGIGNEALYSNTTSYQNIAIGDQTLYSNTVGHRNAAIGAYVLYTNTIGYDNTGFGYSALFENTTGYRNAAFGSYALRSNTIGYQNTAFGFYSLLGNTEGYYNTAIGSFTLEHNTIGNRNAAFGVNALHNNTEGHQNTVFGYYSFFNNTTGDRNVAIGYYTGIGIQTGNYNTIIGANVTGLAANLSNYVIIADGEGHKRIVVDNSGNCYLGDGGVTNYTKIEADGTIEFNGAATVWEDLRVSALSTKIGAIKPPTFAQLADDGAGSTGVFTYMFDDSAEEQVFFSVQMPHAYKEGSNIYPHIHWSPQTVDTGQVDWILEYTFANEDGTFGNTTTLTMSDVGDGTINKHQYTSDDPISGAGLTISSMIMCRLYRDGGQGNDNFVGDAALLEFDIHYELDTLGSRGENTK